MVRVCLRRSLALPCSPRRARQLRRRPWRGHPRPWWAPVRCARRRPARIRRSSRSTHGRARPADLRDAVRSRTPRNVVSYASFRAQDRVHAAAYVLPHLARGRPNVVVFNEDIGLATLGDRLARSRRAGRCSRTAVRRAATAREPCGVARRAVSVDDARTPGRSHAYQRAVPRRWRASARGSSRRRTRSCAASWGRSPRSPSATAST